MSDNRTSGGCGLARCKGGPETGKRKAPRVVFGGGPAFAARVAEQFRRLGWTVCTADGEELYALAIRKNPAAVVIPIDAADESGYLTCAKLRLTWPELRVVLVGERTPKAERFARFVGATLATETTVADAVLKLV